MKRGFYFINTMEDDKDGNPMNIPTLQEGSYEYHDKMFIHRSKDNESFSYKWRVSHVESGSAICTNKTLKEARRIVKELQGFTLWELGSHDDLTKAINSSPQYRNEVDQIKLIIY